jgi:hypothetical protein
MPEKGIKPYILTYYDLKFFARNLKKFAPQGHKSINL